MSSGIKRGSRLSRILGGSWRPSAQTATTTTGPHRIWRRKGLWCCEEESKRGTTSGKKLADQPGSTRINVEFFRWALIAKREKEPWVFLFPSPSSAMSALAVGPSHKWQWKGNRREWRPKRKTVAENVLEPESNRKKTTAFMFFN
jgi:hypothetical protein